MRYIGGKHRQSKKIAEYVGLLAPDFRTYVEPFAGAMGAACRVVEAYPGRRYILSDANPHLMCFWKAAVEGGWDPPKRVTEKDYLRYKRDLPAGDPMTAYLGFAYSFMGAFYSGMAAKNPDGTLNGSRASTIRKIEVLRRADVKLSCAPFGKVKPPPGACVYLDPPYAGRTPQWKQNAFDQGEYVAYARSIAPGRVVLATSFDPMPRWKLLYNYGCTISPRFSGPPDESVHEYLWRVR